MNEIKYKGFIIRRDSLIYVNGKQNWTINNDAGCCGTAHTLKEAKAWVNENPIDDFVATFLFGERPCDIFGWEGPAAVGKYLEGEACSCDGGVVRRHFTTKAEKNAYCQGIEDMDGWSAAQCLDEKEYKTISKYIG